MEELASKIKVELPTYGRRRTIPIILDILTILGFLSIVTLAILQKYNIFFSHLVQIFVNTLLIIGLISFIISGYSLNNWEINELREITGKIILAETFIQIYNDNINLVDIKKINLIVASHNKTRFNSNNKIIIKTENETFIQKFITKDKEHREQLKNYAFFLKTKHIMINIEGIDLK